MSASIHVLDVRQRLCTIKFGKHCTHVAVLNGASDGRFPRLVSLFRVESGQLTVAKDTTTKDEVAQLQSKEKKIRMAGQALRCFFLALRPLRADDEEPK